MLQGFRTFQQTGIVLQVGASPVINVAMSIGQVAETITVQANAPLVETRNLGVGQVMDNKRILDLPLNGRNPADLLAVLPGVGAAAGANASQPQHGRQQRRPWRTRWPAGWHSASPTCSTAPCTTTRTNNLNLPLPFPDALQEFRVETSALTAQNGMHSGAAVNAVTKSGTNAFRGDAFEFFRHHSFNATDPFAAKDRDGDAQGRRPEAQPVRRHARRPAQDATGCSSSAATRARTPASDPDGQPRVRADGGDAGRRLHRVRLAGLQRRPAAQRCARRSSSNRVNPALLQPGGAATSPAGCRRRPIPCGLVQYGLPSATDEGQYVGKVDYQINSKHSLFGRYIATKQFYAAAVQPAKPRAERARDAASAAATTSRRRSRSARTT